MGEKGGQTDEKVSDGYREGERGREMREGGATTVGDVPQIINQCQMLERQIKRRSGQALVRRRGTERNRASLSMQAGQQRWPTQKAYHPWRCQRGS